MIDATKLSSITRVDDGISASVNWPVKPLIIIPSIEPVVTLPSISRASFIVTPNRERANTSCMHKVCAGGSQVTPRVRVRMRIKVSVRMSEQWSGQHRGGTLGQRPCLCYDILRGYYDVRMRAKNIDVEAGIKMGAG